MDRTDNSVADKLSASASFSLLFCTPFQESGRHLLCWPDGSLHHTQDDTWIPSHMPPSLPWIFPKLQTVPQLSLATNDLVRYKVNNQRTDFWLCNVSWFQLFHHFQRALEFIVNSGLVQRSCITRTWRMTPRLVLKWLAQGPFTRRFFLEKRNLVYR